MRTQVSVNSLVLFAPNIGVLVEDVRCALDNPEYLLDALEKAEAHFNNPYLVAACCGGTGPLANAGLISFEEYLARLDEIARAEAIALAARAAKKSAMAARRSEFSAVRHDLILLLLNAGHPYYCANPACGEHTDLSVDHKFPLSRGGTDDISNLHFLCRPCNSSKGDKTLAEWLATQ